MKQMLRPGQAVALLCTAAAPLLLRGSGSLSGIVCGTAGILCAAVLLCLPPRKKPFPCCLRGLIGVAGALFFLWECTRSAAVLGQFAAGTEQEPSTIPLLIAALVLTAAWGAMLGIESLARSAVLWVAAGTLLLIPVGAALLPQISLNSLQAYARTVNTSVWSDGLDFFAGFGGELALLGLLTAAVPRLRPRHVLIFGTVSGGLALLCTGWTAGMLGSWATVRTEPLYTAALSVPPDSAFRPDSLYTVVRILAHYCRTALFFWGFAHCLGVFPQGLHRFGVLGGVFAAVVGSICLTRFPATLTTLTQVFRIPGLCAGLSVLAVRRCGS